MTTKPDTRYTPEEYLKAERESPHKNEYYNGEIFAMAGASRKHNLIVVSIASGLYQQLRNRKCDVFSGDMRVKVSATGLFTYPDVAVVCGPSMFDDSLDDTLLNPDMIIEVLSKSTEAYDRGAKFQNYRLPSLSEYVLVHQEATHVELYTRLPDRSWRFTEFLDSNVEFELRSIGCRLKLGDIYEKVVE
ncbi:MAG: Uma2 family endonuclease [Desulfatirhabdiaceae bacterium]